MVFKRSIMFYRYNRITEGLRETSIPGPEGATENMIRLDYFEGNHYDAIVETDPQPDVAETPNVPSRDVVGASGTTSADK